ncbi:RDD family protein [Lacisediminihabitans profunda]|nr:RDD family protein [Lacisediminihabitans profunda]
MAFEPRSAFVSSAVPTTADDDAELMTGEAVALDLRPTSFVLRAAGALIDFVVYLGTWLLIILALSSPLFGRMLDDASGAAAAVAALVFCLIVLPTAVETVTQGKSLGRLAIGARIVRDDGGSIAFRHAFIRALTGVLEIFFTLGGVAAMVAMLNGRSKRLGDLLAGTYSQNERVSGPTPAVFGMPTELLDWSKTADVARLPDGLARRIAQFLGQAARLSPEARARLARDLANEASAFVSPLPPVHPELFLAGVSVIRRERESRALELERERLEHLAPVLRALPHDFPDR